MRSLPFVFFGSLVACHAGDDTIDNVHDACAPLRLVTSEPPTDAQASGITLAIESWRAVGVGALETSSANAASAAVELRFERAAPAFRGLYDDETGVIYVNSDLRDPRTLGIVIAHELGHAFGLPHVDTPDLLMTPANVTTPPTAEDHAALVARWGTCAESSP